MAEKKPVLTDREKLYALRKTDYGFHGKTTERAQTGGYTMPPRDESVVRKSDRVIRVRGEYTTEGPRHTTLKAARGSARPHGGINRDIGAVENTTLRTVQANLSDWFAARKAKRRQANANRRNRLSRR